MPKTTLYDMLSMVIPGFVALYLIIVGILKYDISSFGFVEYSSAFAFSYLTGLIIHEFGRCLFSLFRNNNYMIECSQKKFCEQLNKSGETKEEKGKDIVDEYYKKYYKTVQNPSAVPIMEAQVSFVRSMFMVCQILIIVAVKLNCGLFMFSLFKTIMFLVIIKVLLFLFMLHQQKRIYFRVFEDSYYYEKIDEGKEK